jgi:4-hydroxyphenylacetate 3-monooxygenase
LFLTYVIVNPQADRSKDWGEQSEELVAQIVDEDSAGLTIRGAKMLGTSSIMANEVFVANLQPLKPGEEALAFSCSLPMNAAGLLVLRAKAMRRAPFPFTTTRFPPVLTRMTHSSTSTT